MSKAWTRVFVETHGCATNQALGEYLEGRLEKAGLRLVEDPRDADVLVLNTCTVKAQTERRMLRRIRELSQEYPEKRLIVAGCMPTVQRDLVRSAAPAALTFGTYEYDQIPSAITGCGLEAGPDLPPFHPVRPRRRGIRIIPISTGCNGVCSYCIVRLIKGRLRSYPVQKIVGEVERASRLGFHEVWLTAQDLSSYGRDGGPRLPQLLSQVLDVAGRMKIRLGMMNPRTLAPILDEILPLYDDPRLYRFAHIPVQSGSNRVLEDMGRGYSAEEWLEVVSTFRRSDPNFAISTDVIVGFPTEEEEDLVETVDLIRTSQCDIVNVSRYEHRPGTPASKLTQLPGHVVKRRSRFVSKVVAETMLQANVRWVGWRGPCRVSEQAPRGGYLARNPYYKPVVLEDGCMIGEDLFVQVRAATQTCLIGARS